MLPPAQPAGRTAAVILTGVAGFQAALVAGAPWGAAAWGGAHPGVLPRRLRVASAVSAGTLAVLAVVAAGAATPCEPWRRRTLLGASALFGAGTVMNAASRSAVERDLWTPVAGTLAVALWRAAGGRYAGGGAGA